MPRIALLVVLALVAASGAGCIENMRDLQGRLSGGETEPAEGEPLEQQALNLTNETPDGNLTPVLKAPIARISVYDDGGALLYKATFVAENETAVLRVDEGVPLTLNAADSETRENGATFATFTWTMGAQTLEGRQVTLTPDEPGIHALVLTVTDSNGMTDAHSVVLGVAPAPFDVVTTFTAGPVAGVLGVGEAAGGAFDVVDVIDDAPVKLSSATIVAEPSADCDVAIEVFDAEGESVGSKDGAGAPDPQTETLALGALDVGAYTVEVSGFACASPGVPVTVTLTYVPLVEGLDADAHGGHAH